MKLRPLGDTGLSVSIAGLGTMTWGQQNTEAQAHEQLDYAVGHGINFIDTAEMYPVPPNAKTQGRTEKYLGSWLKRQPRDRLIIATKVAGPGRRDWIRGGRTDLTPDVIAEAVETSLQRLQTDYIDLYQIHWPQRNVPNFGATEFDLSREKAGGPSIQEQVAGLAAMILKITGTSVVGVSVSECTNTKFRMTAGVELPNAKVAQELQKPLSDLFLPMLQRELSNLLNIPVEIRGFEVHGAPTRLEGP